MDRETVVGMLETGLRVGFVKPTDDAEYLGWILIKKFKPNPRLLEVVTEDERPDLVREERRRQAQPYMLQVIELRRDVHESGDYESESDFRLNRRYWFATLEEVAAQLADWGFLLEQAKEGRAIDAP